MVFVGDALGAKVAPGPVFILTPPGGYDKRASICDINRIQALKPERINFAHCGTYCLNTREGFFEDLKQAHEQWTRRVAEILDENPNIDTQTMWKCFLDQQPSLRRYPDQHFFILFECPGDSGISRTKGTSCMG